MTKERQFAYGGNEINQVSCPVIRATGEPPLGPKGRVARYYDQTLRDSEDQSEGVVSERKAKEVWLEAIEVYERKKERCREPKYAARIEGYIKHAREVAKQLGWLDE